MPGIELDDRDAVLGAVADVKSFAGGIEGERIGAATEWVGGLVASVAVSMTLSVSLLALATTTNLPSGVAVSADECRPT